ncbi:MAG: hypothetical protein AAF447_00615 [Myxococcota bacterium]
MNFYGHLTVATWTRPGREDPRFGLGAMLPDFAGMVRARPPSTRAPSPLSEGIGNHHEVDAVFHGTASFLALCREGADAMRGARRGTVRAAAHIGAELFLDGWLHARLPRAEAYAAALVAGAPERGGAELSWQEDDAAKRFEALRTRLLAFGVPEDHGPEAVFRRLERTLAARPRLRIDAGDAPIVREGLEELAERVETRASALVDELRTGLRARAAARDAAGLYDAP